MISGSDAHQVEDIARGGVLVPAQAACDRYTLARYLIEHNDQLRLLRADNETAGRSFFDSLPWWGRRAGRAQAGR